MLDQLGFAALERQQKGRDRAEEPVGQGKIDAVDQDVAPVFGGTYEVGGIDSSRNFGGKPFVGADAQCLETDKFGFERCEIAPHQETQRPLDSGEVVVSGDDAEKRIGTGRKMREVIGGGCHDEMEIAVRSGPVALCDHRFEGHRGLLEG